MIKNLDRFEILTRMIDKRDNVHCVGERLEYFPSIADAQNGINELILAQQEAIESGNMLDAPDPENYRIYDRVEQCFVSVGDSFEDRLYAALVAGGAQ